MPYQTKNRSFFANLRDAFSLRKWINRELETGGITVVPQVIAVSGEGNPNQEVVPGFIGQLYVDTAGPDVYIATGMNDDDWVAIYEAA